MPTLIVNDTIANVDLTSSKVLSLFRIIDKGPSTVLLPYPPPFQAGLIQIVPTFRFFFFIVFIVGIVVMLEIMFKGYGSTLVSILLGILCTKDTVGMEQRLVRQ